jgi:uncharacterized protein YgiM (DUF1202 family)
LILVVQLLDGAWHVSAVILASPDLVNPGYIGAEIIPWDCDLPLPTAGCEVTVTNVQPQRLNLREDPGTDREVTGKLSEGESVCLLGSPALADGFQWWPLRSEGGTEAWAAAFDPDEPDTPWLTATGRACQGEQVE